MGVLEQILTQLESLREEIAQLREEQQAEDVGGYEIATEVTGHAKATLRKMVAEGKIPHYRVGARVRFVRHELMEWMRAGCPAEPVKMPAKPPAALSVAR